MDLFGQKLQHTNVKIAENAFELGKMLKILN